jgi:hypothetical protein
MGPVLKHAHVLLPARAADAVPGGSGGGGKGYAAVPPRTSIQGYIGAGGVLRGVSAGVDRGEKLALSTWQEGRHPPGANSGPLLRA